MQLRRAKKMPSHMVIFFTKNGHEHFGHLQTHGTLKETPAMAAGVTDHRWTVEELLAAR